jgi:hypothetical protein
LGWLHPKEKVRGKVHEYGLAGCRIRLLAKESKEPQHVTVFKKFKKFKFDTKHPQGVTFSEPAFITCVTPLGKLFAYQIDYKDKHYWLAIFDVNHNNSKPPEQATPVRMRAPTILQPNVAPPFSAAALSGAKPSDPASLIAATESPGSLSRRSSKARTGKREGGMSTSEEKKRRTTKISLNKKDRGERDKKKGGSSRKTKHKESSRDLKKTGKSHSHRSASRRITAEETSNLNSLIEKEEGTSEAKPKETEGNEQPTKTAEPEKGSSSSSENPEKATSGGEGEGEGQVSSPESGEGIVLFFVGYVTRVQLLLWAPSPANIQK